MSISLEYIELTESLKSDMSARANQMLSEPGPKTNFVKDDGEESEQFRLGLAGLEGNAQQPFLTYDSKGPEGLGKDVDNQGTNKFDGVRKIFGLKDKHRDG